MTYTVAMIRAWKTEHETRVERALIDSIPDATFTELELVTKAIADGFNQSFNVDFNVTDPVAKVKRNGITARSRNMLNMVLAASPQVRNFISAISPTVPFLEERLKAGFQKEYDKLRAIGLQGDELFQALCLFASKFSVDLSVQAASLSVVTYLFEVCDVFEK